MADTPDLDTLRSWIGREEQAQDSLDPALVQRFHATLSRPGTAPTVGEPAPRLIHFCLCQPAAPSSALDTDGHPARGGFLPPVPLPRRMWAGSTIRFDGDLRVGDTVTRTSRITDVAVKQGRSGTLCFVTVDHQLAVDGHVRVEDRQTIVYRENRPETPGIAHVPVPTPGEITETVAPTSTLLFRYSALTFNAHRIHYDAAYAHDVEGYPGLVVHGPLQATLLLGLATRIRHRPPDRFRFRSLSSLFDRDPVLLNAAHQDDCTLSLWTARSGGPVAMQAQAEWL